MARREFVSLTLPSFGDPEGYDNNKTRRKSFFRWWNQRSRLQRTIIFMIVGISMFAAIYFLPSWTTLQILRLSPRYASWGPAKNELTSEKRNSKLEQEELGIKIANEQQSLRQQIPEPNGNEIDDQNKPHQIPEPKFSESDDKSKKVTMHERKIIFTGPTNDRQTAVVEACKHAWKAYRKYAWGHDHVHPISKGFTDWFHLALTLVDAIDTLYIMNLKEEYEEAKKFIDEVLTFDIKYDVNLFEVTIRILGSLLSMYHLTEEGMFKAKAIDLGDRLLPSFESPSGIPYSDVNLRLRRAHPPRWGPDSSVSEVSTIQLEFHDLSRITGDSKYEKVVDKVMEQLHNLPKKDGLVPIFINAETGKFRSLTTITLGARGDSYYEYLLKQWIQTGKANDRLLKDYNDSVNGMIRNLLKYSEPNKLAFLGELVYGKNFTPKMDHLVCYLPSVLVLGYHNGLSIQHFNLAKELMHTCYQMYATMPTFLSPEIVHFNYKDPTKPDIAVKPLDTHNLLRPETVESLWYMYYFTGNKTYQDWGWNIFQAFEKHTKVPGGGYTSINNVKNVENPKPRDHMESFFLAETLKYLYLLFSDNQTMISLDKWVFNSEAHPLPIYPS